ncbi:MAG: hypothetical protein VX822_03615 [Candidatus Neomarinimicrobiota bacterium]|nr:hypothetical protein [Candidatus Neomarinimicrobiota bacterium]
MKQEELFGHFEKLANQIDVTILQGKGDFEGGYCTVNGDQFVVLNKTRPLEHRLRVLAKSFSELELGEQYVIPALREFIESHVPESTI